MLMILIVGDRLSRLVSHQIIPDLEKFLNQGLIT